MDNLAKNKAASAELLTLLRLRFEPIAIKLAEREEDVPPEAIRPMRDLSKHMALCQAFAMTRRDKKTVFMDKTSEWCWNPLIGFGLTDCRPGSEAFNIVCRNLGITDPKKASDFFEKFPTLPYGKFLGVVTAPLDNCPFAPDIILIYCNNAQLRSMLWAIKNVTGKIVSTELDAIDSCVYSCVVPALTGEFRVTLPDMGEFERAGAGEGEIILSVPGGRLSELLSGLRPFHNMGMGYTQLTREMHLDFARPPFYNELFEIWGLDLGEDWNR